MTPRTERQLEAVREESREKILETALDLFARRGYAGTSVRMIAREADISPGLLYHYFEGKRGLLRAIFARGVEHVAESFARGAEADAPEERARALIRSVFEIVGDNLAFWRLSYQLRMQAGVLEELAPEFAAWVAEIRARLEEVLRDLGAAEPEADAQALFAAIDGAAQHYAMDPERYPAEDVGDAIIRRFLTPGRDPRNP